MQRLEGDVIALQEVFVVAKTLEKLTLRKTTAPLSWHQCSGYTLYPNLIAIGAGELAVASYFALLT